MPQKYCKQSSTRFLYFAGAIWVLTVCTGMAALYHYENTPGLYLESPSRWPADSRIEKPHNLYHLLMFIHPQCPCTEASIQELLKIMSRTKGLLYASVLFNQPAGADENWVTGRYWDTVNKIPHAASLVDSDGKEALLFGATTSGQTLLYDPDGNLLFQGGITSSRGHEGPNIGEDTILSLVYERSCSVDSTPFFGCPLFKNER